MYSAQLNKNLRAFPLITTRVRNRKIQRKGIKTRTNKQSLPYSSGGLLRSKSSKSCLALSFFGSLCSPFELWAGSGCFEQLNQSSPLGLFRLNCLWGGLGLDRSWISLLISSSRSAWASFLRSGRWRWPAMFKFCLSIESPCRCSESSLRLGFFSNLSSWESAAQAWL